MGPHSSSDRKTAAMLLLFAVPPNWNPPMKATHKPIRMIAPHGRTYLQRTTVTRGREISKGSVEPEAH